MVRLTQRTDMGLDEYNEINFINPADPEGAYNLDDIVNHGSYEVKLAIAERIAAYEDTGLTPEEITNAQAAMRSALAMACELQAFRNGITTGRYVEVTRCAKCNQKETYGCAHPGGLKMIGADTYCGFGFGNEEEAQNENN